MTSNPVSPPTALLKAQMPAVYRRFQIYDPTWGDPSYDANPQSVKIVPAVGSLVQDSDETPLWVVAIDPVTFYPSYQEVPLSTENDNVVSMLNYGNSVLRLYLDYRATPYPATPDSKCIFIGKSPRFYTLTRYAGTLQETVISQYFDTTGRLVSQMVPLNALDSTNTSWFLPRCNVSANLDPNEEILAKIFTEDGTEVYTALLFAKQSAIINEDVVYQPTIVNMTVAGNQQLANGTFYLFENQDFGSLGLNATLVYDDGSTATAQIDGVKCILYGQTDFISSFAGLLQYVTVKYFRSGNESISTGLADPTGEMISVQVPVTVVPNTLGTTVKIVPLPSYNAITARYVMRYWMYFSDGRSKVDISGLVTVPVGSLVTDSSHFGVSQTYAVSVDMSQVDPTHYPTSTTYLQNFVIQFGPPTSLVRWTIKDANTSPYIYGQDNSSSRRPAIKWDATKKLYFVPAYLFGNAAAFINSFYTMASPPYDPEVAAIPQQPTHFTIRDMASGNMVISAPIPITTYAQAFNIIGDTTGSYLNGSLVVEFLNVISASVTNVLYAGAVDVSAGSYLGS